MRCPICKTPVEEPRPGAGPSTFPFCSDRCKLIDLGRWLDGKYQIPVVDADDAEEDDTSLRATEGPKRSNRRDD